MPAIKRMAKAAMSRVNISNRINWHPGHMHSGMQAMMGKLSTVDCVVEVHDARIPFIGRNREFRQHLGLIKPHVLVLNKVDLADLSQWDRIKTKLKERGDQDVLLTDLTGNEFSFSQRGYDKLLSKVVSLINQSDRHNREEMPEYKIMVVGIPNVGKSTLINRLRQHHLGSSGEATKTGSEAGVTRHVEFKIRICSRPLIYTLDTPGVLQPSATKDHDRAMKLSLCSAINDRVLNPLTLGEYLLNYLHKTNNYMYVEQMELKEPAKDLLDLCHKYTQLNQARQLVNNQTRPLEWACWRFINLQRKGFFGKVMFD